MSERFVIVGIILVAASGVLGLLLSRYSMIGQRVTTALAVIGAAFGLFGVGVFWMTGDSQPVVSPWSIPGGEFHVAVGGLSAVFLMPVFLMSLLGSIYGLEYEAADRALRQRSPAPIVLRTADGWHGSAGDCSQWDFVSFWFEDFGAIRILHVTEAEKTVPKLHGWRDFAGRHAHRDDRHDISLLRAVSGSYTLARVA